MTECCLQGSCGVLVVDDDTDLASALQDLLTQNNIRTITALSGAEALNVLRKDRCICLALVDLVMPLMDGIKLMDRIHELDPQISIIIMTGFGTIASAVEAIKRGAEDYVTKPFDDQVILKKVGRILELYTLREQVGQLEKRLHLRETFANIVFVSSVMGRLLEKAQAAAACDLPVLLVGETGTGKELLAHALHAASRRAAGPFLAVNCGALPRELVESELFGHRRGAFTGASADCGGLFVAAQGGTIFLDEISEMPREAQVKLLRMLDCGEVRPVGSVQAFRADVRVITATNRSLKGLCPAFLREDLYFRISTLTLEIPPLRGRQDDVYALTQHFVEKFGKQSHRSVSIDKSAWEVLLRYPFPGNVRELENILQCAIATSTDDPQVIRAKDLRPLLKIAQEAVEVPVPEEKVLSMENIERLAIQQALHVSGGNRTKAAKVLGISRSSLYRKISTPDLTGDDPE